MSISQSVSDSEGLATLSELTTLNAKSFPLTYYRASKDLSQCTKDYCKFEFFEHKQ